MELEKYFAELISRVENSDISNQGKDKDGFFEPTRIVLLQRLNMLKDLHAKPHAKSMMKMAWSYVVEHLPPEWLVMNDAQKKEMKKMLEP